MYKEIRIVYTEAAFDEILKLLKKVNITRYVNYTNVQAKWGKNVQHLGTHTWPGMDNLMVVIPDNERANILIEYLREFKSKLKDGVDLFVIVSPVEEII